MSDDTEWKPTPTPKSEGIEDMLSSFFSPGTTRKDSIESKQCVFGCGDVDIDSFKDDKSLKEYHVSGMCQTCQDKVF